VIGSNLVEEASIHTNLLAIEHILRELSAKGEEKLAEQLANFYIS
jgi:hypothetical protein